MKGSEKAIEAVHRCIDTLVYFVVMLFKENFRNYIRRAGVVRAPRGTMAILGNGPSLKTELQRLTTPELLAQKDFMAVNFFAEDNSFEILQPTCYILSDPMFFRQSAYRERVIQFYAALNRKVAWPMNLYVQYYNPEHFDYRAVLPNPLIRIIPFHTQLFKGFSSWQFWLFRHGLGSANFGTVVQIGEYVALLLGYRRIELYGVDHTLLDGLCVDDENRLCRADSHYYDQEKATPKPIFQKVPPDPYTMAIYLNEVAGIFRGHEVMRAYADRLGARIVNCTRGSMIDAYERES